MSEPSFFVWGQSCPACEAEMQAFWPKSETLLTEEGARVFLPFRCSGCKRLIYVEDVPERPTAAASLQKGGGE